MRFIVMLHLFSLRLRDSTVDAAKTLRHSRSRGSVSIEQILWAVAIIAIVAIVVGAITSYVTAQAGRLGRD